MIMPGERISSIFYRNIWSLSNSGNISAEYQQSRDSGDMTETQHPATELPDTGDTSCARPSPAQDSYRVEELMRRMSVLRCRQVTRENTLRKAFYIYLNDLIKDR